MTDTQSNEHKHAFRFDGDDPYLMCECGQYEDAMTGRVITYGKFYKEPVTTPKPSQASPTQSNEDKQSLILQHLGNDCICKYKIENDGISKVMGRCVYSKAEKLQAAKEQTND